MDWHIFCEESGDKGIPWVPGSSNFYVVTAILVRTTNEQALRDNIEKFKYKVLRMSSPLEWKRLEAHKKRNDKLISRFFKKIEEKSPQFLVSTVICNKHETNGPGLVDRNVFMNYLYGLMFKRISWFLTTTNSRAKLTIDRNTDPIAQESLRNYISSVSRYQTGDVPRHSKPKWINPEEDPILGFSDFISGVTLRAMNNYFQNVSSTCKSCGKPYCIYDCSSSNFNYKSSFSYIINWNHDHLPNWEWKGLLYHPYKFKDNHRSLILPT